MEIKDLKDLLLSLSKEDTLLELKELLDSQYSVDIATALDEIEQEDLALIISLLTPAEVASIIEESNEELQKRILEPIDVSVAIQVFTYMSTDDIADLLGILNTNQRKNFLKHMKERDSKEVQMLLGFDSDSAGGIMTTQYISLRSDLTIKDAFVKIRTIGPRTEVIETIFIVSQYNELIGTADLRDVLIAPDDSILEDITNENVLFVYPETDQEEVSLLVSKYDLKAIPVVNKKHIILGIITVDDIIDVIVEEQTEDLLMLSGVSKDEEVGSPVAISIKRRLPWLIVNLATAFLASFTVGLFEDVIVQVVALAATMPIVAGMGGNAGTQTLSIVIRSIALGNVDIKKDWKYAFNEVALSFVNGSVTGLITGFVLYIRYSNLFLSLIIFIAMIGNLVIAGFFGFLIPLLLKKLKLDPAVSSSIFLTTATDVGGFFIFLGLAKVFLPQLL